MKQKESINTEVLVELVNKLAEISKWIAGEQPGLDAAYEKYQAFYIPVSEALKDFGIRLEYNGYAYILEAVRIIVDRNTYDIRLKTDVYPHIAAKYNIRQPACIEHNIRNAIGVAYRDNERNPGSNMMNVFERKPTNKQFLMYVADSVRRSMYESGIHAKSAS